jgi:hypothetical protein
MSRRIGLFSALVFVLAGAPSVAHAGGGESVSLSTPNPDRLLSQNGQYVDVTSSPRPQNRNPTGVNFTDCEQDLRLDFPVVVAGFDPADNAHLEVWAGAGSVDCTQDANRLPSSGAAHPCWQVAASTGPLNANTELMLKVPIFARDVLRYEQPPTAANATQPYDPGFHDGTDGESACHVQPSDAAVSLTIAFIPVLTTQNAIGTSFAYPLLTDLVAPAPPPHVSAMGGSGLLDVSWTPASDDPDDVGFAVWTAAAQNGSCGSPALQSQESVLPSGQGISLISPQYLAGEVDDPMATELTQTNDLTGDARYAAVVTSVDGSGNYGPTSPAACATPTASSPSSSSSPSSKSSTVKAGCGCTAAGSRSDGWTVLLAASALLATLARRRTSRGCRIGACADGHGRPPSSSSS